MSRAFISLKSDLNADIIVMDDEKMIQTNGFKVVAETLDLAAGGFIFTTVEDLKGKLEYWERRACAAEQALERKTYL